eukprot:gene26664-65942_t
MCAVSMETMRGTKARRSPPHRWRELGVRVYNGKTMINTIQARGGGWSRRALRAGNDRHCIDNTLIITVKSGSVMIKMLPRTASLEHCQEIPLKVPKKTKLYSDGRLETQTQREKDFGIEMHRVFQRDLCKLRLQTARAYVKILTDGQGPLSYTAGSSLRLTAHVQGLGPLFKIKLNIQNTGTKSLTAIPIVFTYNKAIYMMWKPMMVIPVLVPSLVYNYEVAVRCIDESAGSDVIRVYVCSSTSSVPIITAL